MNTILLSEPIEESAIKLREAKAHVVVSPDPSDAIAGRLLEEADALILRTATRVTREMLHKAKRLKVVSRTGGGLNNVDVDAATDHRVVVCVPGQGHHPRHPHRISGQGEVLDRSGHEVPRLWDGHQAHSSGMQELCEGTSFLDGVTAVYSQPFLEHCGRDLCVRSAIGTF